MSSSSNSSATMLISDELFDAYLRRKTKAHLTFGQAGMGEPSHPICDWQQHLTEAYQAGSSDRLRSSDREDCFVGSPSSEDLRSAGRRQLAFPNKHYGVRGDLSAVWEGRFASTWPALPGRMRLATGHFICARDRSHVRGQFLPAEETLCLLGPLQFEGLLKRHRQCRPHFFHRL
jgi:hypothetical protein